MSNASTEITVAPPNNEICDDCGVARSLVAVTTKMGRRLTFCGHDADKISDRYKAEVFVAIHDTRK